MTQTQFNRLIVAHRLRGDRTIGGCRAVLVDGLTAYAAAARIGIEQSALSRALAKLRRPICEHCGHPL